MDYYYTYPTFPLTPNYDNSIKQVATLNKSQYNNSGVIVRGLIGINPLTRSISFNVNTDKVEAVKSFLNLHLGKPIRISFNGGSTLEPELFRITSFTWTYHSKDVIGLSCEIEQTRQFAQ